MSELMIRVELGPEMQATGSDAPAKFCYAVPAYGIEGRSRQPLLDACRKLQALGVDGRAGLFRAGRNDADISCSIAVGAATTVQEGRTSGPRFVKWMPHPRSSYFSPMRQTEVAAGVVAGRGKNDGD